MSRTPEFIISTPRKILRNVVGFVAILLCGFSALCFLAGVGGILYLILGIALAITADRIKYKLVKKVEVGGYELV